MEPTPELIAQLHREDIEQARRMTPAQKLAAGPELFDYACEITKAGIRMQNPGIEEAQMREILRARIEGAERRERGPLFSAESAAVR
jgi:hypothetical protein